MVTDSPAQAKDKNNSNQSHKKVQNLENPNEMTYSVGAKKSRKWYKN